MFHHDARDYDVAKGEAAREGRKKLEEIIERGRATAEAVVHDVSTRTIRDVVAKANVLRLTADDDGDEFLSVGGELMPMHKHARSQLLEKAGMPAKFANELSNLGGWGQELVAHNVNQLLAHQESKYLVRQENGGLVKGFLSDKFKRYDCRPLLDAFLGACGNIGLLPYEGVGCDTKMRVRAVLDHVFEPLKNEVMIFGIEFGNSDYGDGGVTLNAWCTRIWCTNLAITTKCFRKIHLGRRMEEFDGILSDATHRLDAEAMASAIGDLTLDMVGPDRINLMLDTIKNAGDEEIKGRDGIDKLLERAIGNKNEFVQIKAMYEGPDVMNLPEGNTVWRLSNAVSFFAQRPELSPDRKLELQAVAGQLLAV